MADCLWFEGIARKHVLAFALRGFSVIDGPVRAYMETGAATQAIRTPYRPVSLVISDIAARAYRCTPSAPGACVRGMPFTRAYAPPFEQRIDHAAECRTEPSVTSRTSGAHETMRSAISLSRRGAASSLDSATTGSPRRNPAEAHSCWALSGSCTGQVRGRIA